MASEPERCRDLLVTLTAPGDQLDSLAFELSRCYGIPVDHARSLLIENNGLTDPGVLPGMALFTGTQRLGPDRAAWLRDRPLLEHQCHVLPRNARQLLERRPRAIDPLLAFAEWARESGWLTGESLTKMVDYGTTAAGSAAGTASAQFQRASSLAQTLYAEALQAVGPELHEPRGFAKLESFLRDSPTYRQLRDALSDLPVLLQARLGKLQPGTGVHGSAAWFQRQFAVPMRSSILPSRQLYKVASLLRDDVLLSGRISFATSWLIPAGLALYSVSQAPTAYEAGRRTAQALIAIPVGVGFGTGATVALVVVLGGGVGFVVAFVVAGAAGYYAGEATKKMVGALYDQTAELIQQTLSGLSDAHWIRGAAAGW